MSFPGEAVSSRGVQQHGVEIVLERGNVRLFTVNVTLEGKGALLPTGLVRRLEKL